MNAVHDPSTLLLARIRRLANAEYDASVQALLSTDASPALGFPPDLRQDGFSVNADQRIDTVLIARLSIAADALTSEAQDAGTLARLAPCDDADDPAECAKRFISRFGQRAYRRPLDEDEAKDLYSLYVAGAQDATYEEGIAHVVRGVLQSAGFLYLTELGAAAGEPSTPSEAPQPVELTPYEMASALSYFLTSAPPDAELLEAATRGELSDPENRAAQARRLLANDPRARDTTVRLVREWLGIDRIERRGKDSLVYPDFASDRPSIIAESKDFVRAVAFRASGTLSELFGATWTVDSGPLELYETGAKGPIKGSTELKDRVGILNQAAFLATYANANESHPVFRGVAVARRVTCMHLDSPASFNIQVFPPLPDPSLTTRERYDVHAKDEICAGCHDLIDPLGFAFEHFDGMGAYRQKDNGQNVDSSVEVAFGQGFDGSFADSNELARTLAASETVKECFARFMYRAAAADGDSAATLGEPEFIDFWKTLSAEQRDSLQETLIAFVKQPDFGWRLRL
jgi:hypothetical protein